MYVERKKTREIEMIGRKEREAGRGVKPFS